jgi:hypothetical protein
MDLSLLISTIVMLKQCTLKDYLFRVMTKINNLLIQTNFNQSIKYNITEDIIEDINIILDNMDEWMRHYNSQIRMTMKKELMSNLGEIKKMFYVLIK